MPASSQTQLRSCVLRCGRSGFAVDYWGRNPCVGAVFLTHAHADHLCGLSEAWEPDGRTVYCSSVTKALLLRKFPRLKTRRDVRIETLVPNVSVVLRLPDRSSSISFTRTRRKKSPKTVAETLLSVDDASNDFHVERHENHETENDEFLTVTALDAGHCPGSVAFLFEGKCGRVFHTGDWRREDWCGKASTPFGYYGEELTRPKRLTTQDENTTARPSTLRAKTLPFCLTRERLDLLLLDNTYGDPSYVFPSRHEAASKICGLIKKIFAENENADVYVGVDSLGKEPLLAAIARAIGEPVRVTPERFHASIAALEAATEGADEMAARGDDDDDDDDDRLAKESRDGDPLLGAAPRGSLTCASTSTCRVFALPKQRVTREKLAAVAWHTGREIVGILPTGWAAASHSTSHVGRADAPNAFAATAAGFGGDAAFSRSLSDDFQKSTKPMPETTDRLPVVHAVPYSLHASYDELEALVRLLRPRAVVGNTRAPRNKKKGAPTLDVAAHFKHLCGGCEEEEEEEEDDERVLLKSEKTETLAATGDVSVRLASASAEVIEGDCPYEATTFSRDRRGLAPRGHFVSHAFNAFHEIKTADEFRDGVHSRRLRLKPFLGVNRSSIDARARDEVVPSAAVPSSAVPSAVPGKGPSICAKSPGKKAKAKETVNHSLNPPVAIASELATLTKTYVEAVSRLVRNFPKRARARRGADARADRDEDDEGEGEGLADAEDEKTAREKKKRRHVPRWVADGFESSARAARA